jgi:hypothetical protein
MSHFIVKSNKKNKMFSIHFITGLGILLGGWLSAISAYSQTVNQIKDSNDYYWGEGIGKTGALADKDALSMLINSISINVESTFSMQSQKKNTTGNWM